jgi:hypothetical protein
MILDPRQLRDGPEGHLVGDDPEAKLLVVDVACLSERFDVGNDDAEGTWMLLGEAGVE